MIQTVKLRVREIAEQQGLNITTLARAAELSYSQAWKIWHDRVTQLEFATLAKLANALDVPVGELFKEQVEGVENSINNRTPLRVAA